MYSSTIYCPFLTLDKSNLRFHRRRLYWSLIYRASSYALYIVAKKNQGKRLLPKTCRFSFTARQDIWRVHTVAPEENCLLKSLRICFIESGWKGNFYYCRVSWCGKENFPHVPAIPSLFSFAIEIARTPYRPFWMWERSGNKFKRRKAEHAEQRRTLNMTVRWKTFLLRLTLTRNWYAHRVIQVSAYYHTKICCSLFPASQALFAFDSRQFEYQVQSFSKRLLNLQAG